MFAVQAKTILVRPESGWRWPTAAFKAWHFGNWHTITLTFNVGYVRIHMYNKVPVVEQLALHKLCSQHAKHSLNSCGCTWRLPMIAGPGFWLWWSWQSFNKHNQIWEVDWRCSTSSNQILKEIYNVCYPM